MDVRCLEVRLRRFVGRRGRASSVPTERVRLTDLSQRCSRSLSPHMQDPVQTRVQDLFWGPRPENRFLALDQDSAENSNFVQVAKK